MPSEKMLNDLADLAMGNLNSRQGSNQLMNVIRDTIQHNYVDKFNLIYREYKDESRKDLQKELQLIEAIRPFLSESGLAQMEALTNMLGDLYAMQRMANDLNSVGQMRPFGNEPHQQSLNYFMQKGQLYEDGYYNVDELGNPVEEENLPPNLLMMFMVLSQFM